jgi:hypothetical protein
LEAPASRDPSPLFDALTFVSAPEDARSEPRRPRAAGRRRRSCTPLWSP